MERDQGLKLGSSVGKAGAADPIDGLSGRDSPHFCGVLIIMDLGPKCMRSAPNFPNIFCFYLHYFYDRTIAEDAMRSKVDEAIIFFVPLRANFTLNKRHE